jgi:adenylate cyclase
LTLLAAGVGATALALGAYFGGVMERYELDSIDARFAIRGEEAAPEDIVIVAIDATTFSALDLRWPFPRSVHGEVVLALHEADARAIAYDVQFTEPSEDPAEDNALIEAAYEAGGVVFATTEVDAQGRTAVLGGEDLLADIDARAANAILPSDTDGTIRRFPLAFDGLVSFSVAAAEAATGRSVEPGAPAWIDFHGPPGTIRAVSFSDVAEGDADPGLFRDAIVLIGPVAPSLQDLHSTATTGSELMSGVEIQANAVSTVLRGFPLGEAPRWVDIVATCLLGLFAPLLALRLSIVPTLVASLLAGAAFAVAAQARVPRRIDRRVHLSARGARGLERGDAHRVLHRRRLRAAPGAGHLRSFVGESVVREVVERAGGRLRLRGTEVEGTVMFADLRGFTALAEGRLPGEAIAVLNRHLAESSEAILDHGGTLISYLGDGILAVFGAPIEQPDHAERAFAAAREMLATRVPGVNAWLAEQGLDIELQMGIGLCSGAFVAGNVGSERRLEYTAIGDTVNTASRIEAMTKDAGLPLLVSDSTRALLPADAGGLEEAGEHSIRGRQGQVRLWALASVE